MFIVLDQENKTVLTLFRRNGGPSHQIGINFGMILTGF